MTNGQAPDAFLFQSLYRSKEAAFKVVSPTRDPMRTDAFTRPCPGTSALTFRSILSFDSSNTGPFGTSKTTPHSLGACLCKFRCQKLRSQSCRSAGRLMLAELMT